MILEEGQLGSLARPAPRVFEMHAACHGLVGIRVDDRNFKFTAARRSRGTRFQCQQAQDHHADWDLQQVGEVLPVHDVGCTRRNRLEGVVPVRLI